MSEPETQRPLNLELPRLVGEPLSSVEFVQDYWQLHFDGHVVTVFSALAVVEGERRAVRTSPGFRDRLCERIGHSVRHAELVEGRGLALDFEDGARVEISTRSEDHAGPEVLTIRFRGSDMTYVI